MNAKLKRISIILAVAGTIGYSYFLDSSII